MTARHSGVETSPGPLTPTELPRLQDTHGALFGLEKGA